jgi:hypothetical protein
MKVVSILVPHLGEDLLTKCDENEINWPYWFWSSECIYGVWFICHINKSMHVWTITHMTCWYDMWVTVHMCVDLIKMSGANFF